MDDIGKSNERQDLRGQVDYWRERAISADANARLLGEHYDYAMGHGKDLKESFMGWLKRMVEREAE